MRILIIFIALVATTFGQGQDEASTMKKPHPDMASLVPGSTFVVQRKRERFQQNAEKLMKTTGSLSELHLEVLKSTEDGGRDLRWSLTENVVDGGAGSIMGAILAEVAERSKGKSFDFHLDADGKTTTLLDKKAVIATYTEFRSELATWMTENKVDAQIAQSVLAGIDGFTKEETVEDLALRDIRLIMHRPDPMPTDDAPIKRYGEMANPVGGEAAVSRITTAWESPAPGQVWLVHTEELDFEKSLPKMMAAIEMKALEAGQALPEGFQFPKLELVERMAIVGAKKVLPDRVVVERRRLQNGAGVVERDEFLVSLKAPKKEEAK